MKTKIFLFILICLQIKPIVAKSRNVDFKFIQYNYEKFSYFTTTKDFYDSIYIYEKAFYNSLLNALQNDFKSTFKQLPQILKDGNQITFLSSSDQKLHFICWDDESGGTMRNASCIVAYESKGKYVVDDFYKESENGSFNPLVKALHQVLGKNGPVYLIFDLFIGSTALYYPSCYTLTIENGKLNKKAKYIKTQSGLNNNISF